MRILNCFVIALLLLLCDRNNVYSQNDKDKIIVAYINNFAKYTSWPNESELDSFKIAIITENKGLIKELKEFSENRKIKGKPVKLSVYNSDLILDKHEIIIVTNQRLDFLDKIYDLVEGEPVLLISEGYIDKRIVMINLYKTEDDKLLFEVNKANIVNQKLTLDPEILLAGGTEIDVAELYRTSQLSMRSLQKSIEKIRDSLELLNKNVQISLNLISIQESKLALQNKLLFQR